MYKLLLISSILSSFLYAPPYKIGYKELKNLGLFNGKDYTKESPHTFYEILSYCELLNQIKAQVPNSQSEAINQQMQIKHFENKLQELDGLEFYTTFYGVNI